MEYLGFWITREGIAPLKSKVETILNIEPPRTKKQLRRFNGLVNYYRDLWFKRSEVMTPLSALVSPKTSFKWTEQEQRAFDQMKKIISKETLLYYPDFNKEFHIHTDASKVALGAVISQDNKPVAFYSRKLNPAQTRYTTTERELLAIVETLKEFRSILLGQKIVVFTDHKNLTYKNFNTDRVMRWRLIIEEFGPKLQYVKGPQNVVADALSRLDIASPTYENFSQEELADVCLPEEEAELPPDIYPLDFRLIRRMQVRDKNLIRKVEKFPNMYTFHAFRGGDKYIELITKEKNCNSRLSEREDTYLVSRPVVSPWN